MKSSNNIHLLYVYTRNFCENHFNPLRNSPLHVKASSAQAIEIVIPWKRCNKTSDRVATKWLCILIPTPELHYKVFRLIESSYIIKFFSSDYPVRSIFINRLIFHSSQNYAAEELTKNMFILLCNLLFKFSHSLSILALWLADS